VYSANGLHVTDTMVDGQWLLRDRHLLTLDYHAARTQQAADAQRLLAAVRR
jgi:branched-subunit amino acid aminotransferase/4-amino-4-deoxychorismate lyase